jgi:hypothetical protein
MKFVPLLLWYRRLTAKHGNPSGRGSLPGHFNGRKARWRPLIAKMQKLVAVEEDYQIARKMEASAGPRGLICLLQDEGRCAREAALALCDQP